MKKPLALIALAVSAALIASCSPGATPTKVSSAQSSSAQLAAKQELTFVLSDEPDGLDPNVTSNSFAAPYLTNLVEGLVSYNQKNELIPGLAEKWDISPDGLTYTFHLRQGLKWSDGSALTAKDFEYSFFRVLDPKTTAQYVDLLLDYVKGAKEFNEGKTDKASVGVKATDDNTFVVTLAAPASHFLDILSMWTFVPMKEATIVANGDKWTQSSETFVTSGPFKVGEIKQGESMTLVKNPNYWDAGKVTLDKLTFRMIKDQSTALNAYLTGEVQGIRTIPLADYAKMKAENPGFVSSPTYATTFYLINNKKAPYDNVKVRKALNLAIDRQSLITNVLHGSDKPAFSPIAPGYVVDGKDYADGRSEFGLSGTANVAEAKKLLAEAGYPDGKGFPPVELSYYSNPQVKLIAEAMAQMLHDNLGLTVTTPNQEWKVYYAAVQAGKYDIGAMGWGADYMNPMTFFPLFVTGNVVNNAGYANPSYDKLVAQAKSETDKAKQVALLRQADDIVSADYPVIPLFYRSTSLMMSPKIQGWFITPMSATFFKWAKVTQ